MAQFKMELFCRETRAQFALHPQLKRFMEAAALAAAASASQSSSSSSSSEMAADFWLARQHSELLRNRGLGPRQGFFNTIKKRKFHIRGKKTSVLCNFFRSGTSSGVQSSASLSSSSGSGAGGGICGGRMGFARRENSISSGNNSVGSRSTTSGSDEDNKKNRPPTVKVISLPTRYA